eukprot:6324127-Amphidinium_carterae.2
MRVHDLWQLLSDASRRKGAQMQSGLSARGRQRSAHATREMEKWSTPTDKGAIQDLEAGGQRSLGAAAAGMAGAVSKQATEQ